MMRFTLPRDIYYGKGSMEQLKSIKGERAVLVLGGGSMRKFGFVDKALDYLKAAGIEVKLIEGVEPDPSVETVLRGAEVMRDFNPDWIIAMGGGSPIDAAKAMWVFYEHPEITFEDIKDPFTIPELRNKAKFLAIPSTSGTATEVTAFSVITDYKTEIKYPLADFNITPDVAIVDSALAETMPPRLTANTGMDALTHAIEAYVATLHSPFTDPLALKAIEMVKEFLVKSYDGDNEAREQMHYAQCLAGMAFSNALLGICHSMAHKTGAVFHIPHGCANAIYLPFVIEFNKKEALDRYAAISKQIGLIGNNDEELVQSLIEMINELNKRMGVPQTLKEYGVDKEKFDASLDLIAERAIQDACTGSNPRKINKDEMKKLFKCVYDGVRVDF
ncbi:NADPH-dependent butanol dehydrogenase [Clostridium sp. SHJSY1]|uniref:NADPH-dependent butanol dehydrogenase n=1 Tax=Clostridium sp. SHJSY1 TaxID=2942483 RepID=UPI002875FCE5|nr:NADPH-dependent butanol dehydrogenase [Clostridium sp. SHJSY1]MDS0526104.1 NADPH-dependent butanol dehydrogenase [Clostridium sp. SHJSY1]